MMELFTTVTLFGRVFVRSCHSHRITTLNKFSSWSHLRNRRQRQTKLNCRALSISEKLKTTTREGDDDSSRQHTKSTMVHEEVDKFSRLAQRWWDEGGEFAALHTMNRLRIPLVRDGLLEIHPDQTRCDPLEGLKILDVGCGGGILSEPLARLGADVVGLDASPENIQMAEWHAKLDPELSARLQYKCTLVEDLMGPESEYYDGVVASEILEHVGDPLGFVAACAKLVKPGGSIFITTLNKTFLSNALAIFAAERILHVVPAGAHDWNKFVPPADLQFMLRQNGIETVLVHGMLLNPFTLRWQWVKDTSMNYALHAVKPAVQSSQDI